MKNYFHTMTQANKEKKRIVNSSDSISSKSSSNASDSTSIKSSSSSLDDSDKEAKTTQVKKKVSLSGNLSKLEQFPRL